MGLLNFILLVAAAPGAVPAAGAGRVAGRKGPPMGRNAPFLISATAERSTQLGR